MNSTHTGGCSDGKQLRLDETAEKLALVRLELVEPLTFTVAHETNIWASNSTFPLTQGWAWPDIPRRHTSSSRTTVTIAQKYTRARTWFPPLLKPGDVVSTFLMSLKRMRDEGD